MATLNNFIYCLNAERDTGNGEALNAKGILTVLTPEFVPGSFSFSIIFSLLDVDTTSNNSIRIVFREEAGKEIINTGELPLPPIQENKEVSVPQKYNGYNLSLDFRNVIFEKDGEYATDIFLNNVFVGSCSTYVKGRRT